MVIQASNPDPYRGLWGGHRDSTVQSVRAGESQVVDGVCSSADKYIEQLDEVLEYSIPKGKLAAFVAESIQVKHNGSWCQSNSLNISTVYMLLQM